MPALPGTPRQDAPSAEAGAHLAATTPDGSSYWDPGVFATEMEQLFHRSWICVARAADIPAAGDYLVRQIGQESVVLVRGREGQVGGFYNVCRHRGTRLLTEPSGQGLTSIVCPYHAWSYSLEGRLIGAGHMGRVVDFDKEGHPLFPVRVDEWGGFLWANLEAEGRTLREEFGGFFDEVARFPIESLRRARQCSYEVEANWKILVENYSECYHCAPVHPELNRITHYLSGENTSFFLHDGKRSRYAGGTMTFSGNYQSMTRTGYTTRPPLAGMTDADRRRVYYWTLFPNTFFSLHPDYLMIHRTWPVSASHSRVECEFLFAPEAMAAPGFDPSDAVDIWDEVNRQDWRVCELAQAGTRSRMWHGGRYSDTENLVWDFDRAVRDLLDNRDAPRG